MREMHAGFFFRARRAAAPRDAGLDRFIEDGPAPVYVGWGSMQVADPQALLLAVIQAAMSLGARAVVLAGGAGLTLQLLDPDAHAAELAYAAASCFFVTNVDHRWLLPQCSCAIIHGGAGTTAAALRSGRPMLISPVYWDQPWFADRIVRAAPAEGAPCGSRPRRGRSSSEWGCGCPARTG